eukprot:g31989.t1
MSQTLVYESDAVQSPLPMSICLCLLQASEMESDDDLQKALAASLETFDEDQELERVLAESARSPVAPGERSPLAPEERPTVSCPTCTYVGCVTAQGTCAMCDTMIDGKNGQDSTTHFPSSSSSSFPSSSSFSSASSSSSFSSASSSSSLPSSSSFSSSFSSSSSSSSSSFSSSSSPSSTGKRGRLALSPLDLLVKKIRLPPNGRKLTKQDLEPLLRQGADINGLTSKHYSPLGYAVQLNQLATVELLLELKADLHQKMGTMRDRNVLRIAVETKSYDSTEMVRVLLSKGSDPYSAQPPADNLSMRHWFQRAKQLRRDQTPEMKAHELKVYEDAKAPRVPELYFGIIGQLPALHSMIEQVTSFVVDRQAANQKPLVILCCGPPGHGKTFLARNVAKALTRDECLKEVACAGIKDDADLWGSNMGGGGRGMAATSDGELTSFLRARQHERTVVFLDEIEKMKDLTSALGWGQAKKIFQTFLEPWQEGTLSDRGANSIAAVDHQGHKIKVDRSVWILTCNLFDSDIKKWANVPANKKRIDGGLREEDCAWIHKELVNKTLKPGLIKFFASIDESLVALARRVDGIVPFLPFSSYETKVVADTVLREYFGRYRDAPVPPRPEANNEGRQIGNVVVSFTPKVVIEASKNYQPESGASSIQEATKSALRKLQMEFVSHRLKKNAPCFPDSDPNNAGKMKVWIDAADDEYHVLYKQPDVDPRDYHALFDEGKAGGQKPARSPGVRELEGAGRPEGAPFGQAEGAFEEYSERMDVEDRAEGEGEGEPGNFDDSVDFGENS